MVPLAGIEPALLAELDFESSASTNSATGASRSAKAAEVAKPAEYSGRRVPVSPRVKGGAEGTMLDHPNGFPQPRRRQRVDATGLAISPLPTGCRQRQNTPL